MTSLFREKVVYRVTQKSSYLVTSSLAPLQCDGVLLNAFQRVKTSTVLYIYREKRSGATY